MKRVHLVAFLGIAAAFLILVSTHIAIKNVNQLGAAQPSIEELLVQLKSLQAQLAAKQAQIQTTYQFTRTLKVGDRGEDVRQLQIFLNKDTLTQIAQSGDGSPGKETTYFGLATSRAVSRFQEKYKLEILTPNQLTKGTGFVGAATVKKLNSLLAIKPGTTTIATNQNRTQTTNTTPTQTNTTSTQTTTQTNTTSTSSSLLPPTNCGAPVITSATSASGTVGSAFSYSITITSIAAPTYSVSGLPSGITLSGSSIVGTPSVAGTYAATITATSNCGTGTKTLTITINNQVVTVTTGTILTPGSGFSGATAQPGAIGTGWGSNAKSIARWDVVPYQVFAGNFNLGVLAFHINDIDRVAFSVNGGAWTNISSPSINPQTANTSDIGNPSNGVNEYWATLRASDFQDGQIEVRAIAYPKIGVPRVLDPLILYANSHGTLSSAPIYISPNGNDSTGDGSQAKPYQTILMASLVAPAGATVYMSAGDYHIGTRYVGFRDDGNKWLTFTAAPGVSRNSIRIFSDKNVDPRYGKIKLSNISLDFDAGDPFTASGLWLEKVNMYGSGGSLSLLQPNFAGPVYVTDTSMHDIDATPLTFPTLVRNLKMAHILGHGLNDPMLLVNSSIDDVGPNDPSTHVDGIFWYTPNTDENSIVYNTTLTNINGITIFADQPGSNIAVVNVNATGALDGVNAAVQFGKGYYSNVIDHLYFDNLVLNNQQFYFVDDNTNTTWSNSILKNCTVISAFASKPANQIKNCKTVSGTPIPDFGGPGYVSTNTNTNPTQTSTNTNTTTNTSNGPLLAQWSFDASTISGTTVQDLSGNGKNGTLVSNPTSVVGNFGQALSLNGSNSMSFPTVGLTAPYTISLWANPSVGAGGYHALVANSNGNGLYLFGYANQICFYTNQCNFSNVGIATNQWTHIALVNDGSGSMKYYINGVGDASIPNSNLNANSIGNDSYSESFVGSLDEVRLYNKALSSAEIQTVYNNQSISFAGKTSLLGSVINSIGSVAKAVVHILGF